MLTVIIHDSGEPNVVKLTYELLFRELKDLPDSELIVSENWMDELDNIHNDFVCPVEADCLVSSGFFTSQMGIYKKSEYMKKMAMLSSAVGVNNWANRIYGYKLGGAHFDGIIPIKEKTSGAIHPIQMGFVPGSIIRVKMLKKALATADVEFQPNLVKMSALISMAFWEQGDGNRVHINPNTTYVTTESYVEDMCDLQIDSTKVDSMFKKEYI